MDPVTLGAVVGALVVLAFAFVGAAVTWWVLRKTVALVKRLLVLALGLALVGAVVGAGVALAMLAA